MKKILVIEDEQSIAHTITHSIEREGFSAVWSERGLEGLELLRQGGFALAVLDIGLPDVSGFELCKTIRSFSQVPIIFLTARDEEIDKIVGLEIGADDYVTKPFSPRELAARIKSVLRRAETLAALHSAVQSTGAAARSDAVTTSAGTAGAGRDPGRTAGPAGTEPDRREFYGAGNLAFASAPGGEEAFCIRTTCLHIDGARMQALFRGRRLELTRYEFRLLALLAFAPGRVYSREQIMRRVWGEDSPSLDRTVDAHIKSLRAKFRELDGADPIVTHRGTGYALRDDL